MAMSSTLKCKCQNLWTILYLGPEQVSTCEQGRNQGYETSEVQTMQSAQAKEFWALIYE